MANAIATSISSKLSGQEKAVIRTNIDLGASVSSYNPESIFDKAIVDLNFVTNEHKIYTPFGMSLTPLTAAVTTARNSVATFSGPTKLDSAAANAPRISYSPNTGFPIGLLSEETKTNKLRYSEDFANAGWPQSPNTDVDVTSNAVLAPDGTLTADKLYEATTTSTYHDIFQSSGVAFTAGVKETLSIFVKAAERTRGTLVFSSGTAFTTERRVWFNLSNKTAGAVGPGAVADIEEYPNGWFRVYVTATPDANGVGNVYLRLQNETGLSIYTGTIGHGMYVWGAQLEVGNLTSYIPTSSVAYARVADVVSLTVPVSTEGTIFVVASGSAPISGISNIIFGLSDNSENNRVQLRRTLSTSGKSQVAILTSGVVQAGVETTVKTANEENKYAISWKTNKFLAVEDSVLVLDDTSGSVPLNLNTLHVGSRNGGIEQLNGLVKRIVLIPKALSAEEMQLLTK